MMIRLLHVALVGTALLGLATPAMSKAPPHPDQIVYFGTRSNAPDGAIIAARFDAKTGTLTDLGPVAKVDRPTWVLADPRHALLYAVSETGNDGVQQGGVFSFHIHAATGALSPINHVPSGGGGATFLALARSALLVANYGTGDVARIPVQPDGALTPPNSVVRDTGSGPSPRQKSAHAHGIAIDPTGTYALVSDLGADRVFVYRLDHATLTANDPPSIATKPGSGPRHALFSADGRFVYVNSELSSELTTYAWNGTNGTLTPLQTQSTLAPNYTGTNGAGEILLSRDGRFLYAGNRGEDTIVVYAIDRASGLPHEIQRIASGGKSPWACAFDATGEWLFIANESSGTISVLARDRSTGMVRATSHQINVPHASAIAVMAPPGLPRP